MLLLLVVVVVLLRAVLSFGFRFSFGVGFWAGVRFEVEEDLVPEVRGQGCWVGGVRGVLPGCLGCLCGGRGHPAAWRAAAAYALAVALWMRSAGTGRSEEEVEDVPEDEDEEEVVVLGDVGCAAMRAGAALRATAA